MTLLHKNDQHYAGRHVWTRSQLELPQIVLSTSTYRWCRTESSRSLFASEWSYDVYRYMAERNMARFHSPRHRRFFVGFTSDVVLRHTRLRPAKKDTFYARPASDARSRLRPYRQSSNSLRILHPTRVVKDKCLHPIPVVELHVLKSVFA